MTRDEAIKGVLSKFKGPLRIDGIALVDALEALGLIKFDEHPPQYSITRIVNIEDWSGPKSAVIREQVMVETLRAAGYDVRPGGGAPVNMLEVKREIEDVLGNCTDIAGRILSRLYESYKVVRR